MRLPQPRHHGWTWRRPRKQQLRPSLCSLLQVTFGLSFGVFQVPAKSSRGWRKKESIGGGKREKVDSFVVFVVSLGGSTVQVRVEGTDSYESIAAKVAAKVNILACHWYLSFSGLDLRHLPCPTSVLHCDSTCSCAIKTLGWCTSPAHSRRVVLSSMLSRRMVGFSSYFLPLLGTAASGRFHSASAAAQGAQSKGEGNFNAVPMLLVVRRVEVLLPMAVEGSRSLLPTARKPLRSLNCSRD